MNPNSLKRRTWLIGVCLLACGGAQQHTSPAQRPASSDAPSVTPASDPADGTAEPEPSAEHAAGPPEHPHHDPGPQHRFQHAERWSKVFDDPKRDAWQKPELVMRELRLKPDDTVADLGAGTGYFSVRLARELPKGRVIAVDLEPDMVEHVKRRAREEKLPNLSAHVAAADDPKLPAGVSVVLIVDTYHHLTERTAYMRRLRKQIGADGRVVVVDFRMGKLPVGPPDSHKLPEATVRRELKEAGFSECADYDGLPHQYMLTFAERCPAQN